MKKDDLKFRLEMARERWDDFWFDFRGFFVRRWWLYREWRRKRNPELVELDAFRETVRLEKKLKDFPNAVPLLNDLMAAYKITGEEDKRLDVMRRLRDVEPQEKPCAEKECDADAMPEIDYGISEDLYRKAEALVRGGVRAKAVNFQRRLGIGYNDAAKLCDMLIDRDVVDPDTRGWRANLRAEAR